MRSGRYILALARAAARGKYRVYITVLNVRQNRHVPPVITRCRTWARRAGYARGGDGGGTRRPMSSAQRRYLRALVSPRTSRAYAGRELIEKKKKQSNEKPRKYA